MKKLTIISLIFLSVQLLSQTQSLAYRTPFSRNSQLQIDSTLTEKITKPRPTFGKILHQEFMGLTIGGAATVGFGLMLGDAIPSYETLYLGLVVYSSGQALGIYWVGNRDEVHGSFTYTLLGSMSGTALALSIFGLDYKAALPLLIFPAIGGIIAFYLSAEDVVPAKTDALIEFQNEKVHFGSPRIFLTRIDDTSNKLRYNFELIRVNF